jgi:hypothetical protein
MKELWGYEKTIMEGQEEKVVLTEKSQKDLEGKCKGRCREEMEPD